MPLFLNLCWIYGAYTVGIERVVEARVGMRRLKCAAVNSLSGVASCL